jgi:hypothetical protein
VSIIPDVAKIFGEIAGELLSIVPPIFMALAGLALILTQRRFPGIYEPIPVSHKIAVIGLPGAGKTTLITSLFELIERGVHVENVRLHGIKTIETVNRYIARLNSGERIGPTKERDTFVFRFSYIKRLKFLKRVFEVEIADFPGEFSQRISDYLETQLAENNTVTVKISGRKNNSKIRTTKVSRQPDLEYTLFNKEFFSWIASSKEYLFLIDMAAIYGDKNSRRAIAEITARIKTSWQVIEDATSERGIGDAKNREVHLVFTKADSLIPVYEQKLGITDLVRPKPDNEKETADKIFEKIAHLKSAVAGKSVSNDLTEKTFGPSDVINAMKTENEELFSDLISFFRHRVRSAQIIYVSMKLTDDTECRLGVRSILQAVLP